MTKVVNCAHCGKRTRVNANNTYGTCSMRCHKWVERRFQPECQTPEQHTKCPSGYKEWHSWAENMGKTHKQKRCPSCKLFKVWVPKE